MAGRPTTERRWAVIYIRTIILLVACLVSSTCPPAHASEELMQRIFCDTQQQIERFLVLAQEYGVGETAMTLVNQEAQNDKACGFAQVIVKGSAENTVSLVFPGQPEFRIAVVSIEYAVLPGRGLTRIEDEFHQYTFFIAGATAI